MLFRSKQGAVLDLGKGVQYALDMPLSKAAAYAGATVRVTGLLRAGTLTPTSAVDVVALDPNLAGAATTNGTVTAAATTKQVVVIAFTFPDLTTQPKTLAQIEDLVWDADSSNPSSIRAYYEESSDAAFSITGGVLGYYQITATSAGNCNYSTWSSQARTLAATDATNAGYDLNTATIVYVFPTVGTCGWAGLGQLPGTTSWINGYVDLRVIGHELGHNFGVHHAASVVCRDATGARIAYTARESDDCSYSEYGDPFSIMGGSSNLTHHAWQRQQLGYPVVSTTITPTAGFDQTYNLTALERSRETSTTSQPSAASTRAVASFTVAKNVRCTQPVTRPTRIRRSPVAGVRAGVSAKRAPADTSGARVSRGRRRFGVSACSSQSQPPLLM